MNLSIISIGNELLNGRTINTNATFLGKVFSSYNLTVKRILAIKDTKSDIIEALDLCKSDSQIVICSGGLGPTNDDITKKVVTQYFNQTLEYNDDEFRRIEILFKSRGRELLDLNRDQTLYPKNAHLFINEIGTASAFMIQDNGSHFIFFPGVPSELKHLISDKVIPFFEYNNILSKHDITTQVYRTIYYPESQLYHDIIDIIENSSADFAFYPNYGLVDIIIKGNQNEINRIENDINDRISHKLYSIDPDTTIVQSIRLLAENLGLKISTVESCTGGLIASNITQESGVSSFYEGGAICYSNRYKIEQLNVSPTIIDTFGAVSEECASELALNACKIYKTDLCVSVSGIAGPNGGTPEKPVGTVCFGVVCNGKVETFTLKFNGKRKIIQQRATQFALYQIWKKLKEITGN